MSRKLLGGVAAPVLAAVVAIAVSSIALLIAGESPRTAFQEMWKSIDCTAVGRRRSSTAPCRTTSPASPSPSGSR